MKDTIIIKYDYDKETCWNKFDNKSKKYIQKVIENFQTRIAEFNEKHAGAVAFNFRESGNDINKVKLWDETIIIDDKLFLKNLIFKNKIFVETLQ